MDELEGAHEREVVLMGRLVGSATELPPLSEMMLEDDSEGVGRMGAAMKG